MRSKESTITLVIAAVAAIVLANAVAIFATVVVALHLASKLS